MASVIGCWAGGGWYMAKPQDAWVWGLHPLSWPPTLMAMCTCPGSKCRTGIRKDQPVFPHHPSEGCSLGWRCGKGVGGRPFLSGFEPHREQRQCSWPRSCSASSPRSGDFWVLCLGVVALHQWSSLCFVNELLSTSALVAGPWVGVLGPRNYGPRSRTHSTSGHAAVGVHGQILA